MPEDLERVSFTVPADLLAALDDLVAEWEYDSRSAAARDAFRAFLADHRWERGVGTAKRGAVVVLYDHEEAGVSNAVLDLQHAFPDAIVAVQHIHLDPRLCMETLVVDAPEDTVRELVNRLRSVGGVKRVELSVL